MLAVVLFLIKRDLLILSLQILNNEPENEITLTAFRLLTMDLLILFHVMNEGTINVLGMQIIHGRGFVAVINKP